MTRDVFPDVCSFPTDSERVGAADAVQTDPDLTPAEREFTVTFPEDREVARVYSEVSSTVKGLLRHPHFGIVSVRVSDNERFGANLNWKEWLTDRGPITGVKGYVPIGLLKVSSSPRSNNYPSSVVSDHNPDPTDDGPDSNGGDSP